MNVTNNEPMWRSAIDHSSMQNRTSEPKSRSLDSVRVQTNEEITVVIEIFGSLKHEQIPNLVTTTKEARHNREEEREEVDGRRRRNAAGRRAPQGGANTTFCARATVCERRLGTRLRALMCHT